jgi:hypothetical protein
MTALLVVVCGIVGFFFGFLVEAVLVIVSGSMDHPLINAVSYLGMAAGCVGGFLLARTMPRRRP